jgi:hypothetical protein
VGSGDDVAHLVAYGTVGGLAYVLAREPMEEFYPLRRPWLPDELPGGPGHGSMEGSEVQDLVQNPMNVPCQLLPCRPLATVLILAYLWSTNLF